MIECKECGCPYPESKTCCPECGHPTEYSTNVTDLTNCPNCGAPVMNSVSCDYCGTVFPRKPQPTVVRNDSNDLGVAAAAFIGGLVGGFLSD